MGKIIPKSTKTAPPDVQAIREKISEIMKIQLPTGQTLGGNQWGVYAFYDFDNEPIYVGQTREGISGRISRHLTGQRSDAVAKNVLDPFEVARVCIWPFDLKEIATKTTDKGGRTKYKETPELIRYLNDAESTIYHQLVEDSLFKAVLNEKRPTTGNKVDLPQSYSHAIIPDDLLPYRTHPDVRIARRASTIAQLAKVISEREVNAGLRHVLVLQAQRLEFLANQRASAFGDTKPIAEEEEKIND